MYQPLIAELHGRFIASSGALVYKCRDYIYKMIDIGYNIMILFQFKVELKIPPLPGSPIVEKLLSLKTSNSRLSMGLRLQ